MSSRRELSTELQPLQQGLGILAPAPIHVESAAYSGSLASLFVCVREHKVNLLDVPILPICEAYFLYLLESADTNLDEAAAALSALSYLLERKAWLLLPVLEPEPEMFEDPMELLDPSVHEFDHAIESLRLWEEARSQLFFRPVEAGPNAYELPYELSDVSAADLARALERVLLKAEPDPPPILSEKRRSLSEHMLYVAARLPKEWTALDVLLEPPFTRFDVVYWFLALLELIRLGQASVRLYDGDVQFSSYRES